MRYNKQQHNHKNSLKIERKTQFNKCKIQFGRSRGEILEIFT